MRIAICITTRNRPEILKKTYEQFTKFMPERAMIFIVDDASSEPVPASFRFKENVGVARAKNKCLELAIRWSADHIFMFDDDCYPIADEWWKPYVEHREPHLMYIFKNPGTQHNKVEELDRDDKTVVYRHTRGCMLYFEKRCIETVGGYDTDFGLFGYEHTDITNRIHNSGLTSYRVMDVPDSHKLIHSMDEHKEVKSTVAIKDRTNMLRLNKQLKLSKSNSIEYKEYK